MRDCTVIGLLVLCLGSASRHCHACSNFFFDKNGYSLVAHNMDWVTGEGMVVINKRHVQKRGFQVENDPEFRWTSKYGSVTLTFDGRESTGRGMNEAGLVILEAALAEPQQAASAGLPLLSVAQWAQYQLDTSATVEDVIASDKVVRIWPEDMQSHFLIWDRSGALAVIEWLGGEMTVYQGSTLPVPVIVNSPYESCIANGDDPSGRFKRIVDGLDAYDAATASDGLGYVYSILRDVSDRLLPPVRTLWSVVFDVHAMRLYISTAQNSQLRYLELKDFDFSCQTDVEVLDINSGDTGNVRSAFVPYTTTLNSALVKHAYEVYSSYGFTTPEETINEIIAFPESTSCADGGMGGSGGGSGGSVLGGGTSGSPNGGDWVGGAAGSDVGGKGGSQSQVGGSGAGDAAGADAGLTASSGSGAGVATGAGAGSTVVVGSRGASGCSCELVGSERGSKGLVGLLLCLAMMAGHRGCRRRPG
jgi:penicillin V acylase-like amidase (Ntn superfamily)